MSHLPPNSTYPAIYLARKFSTLPDSDDEWTHSALKKNCLGLECNADFSSVRIIFRLTAFYLYLLSAMTGESRMKGVLSSPATFPCILLCKTLNYVPFVRERTVQTERPPLFRRS
jgi:hypothetical protein